MTPSAYINEAPLSIITNYVILYQLPCMKWLKKIKNARTKKKVKLLMRNAQNANEKKQIDVAVYEGILSIFLVKTLT